jgi:hypothetical protein
MTQHDKVFQVAEVLIKYKGTWLSSGQIMKECNAPLPPTRRILNHSQLSQFICQLRKDYTIEKKKKYGKEGSCSILCTMYRLVR